MDQPANTNSAPEPQPEETNISPSVPPQAPSEETPAPKPASRRKLGLILTILGVLVVTAGLYVWFQSSAQPTKKERTVKIGLIAPLSGENVNDGQLMKRSLELAVRDFNEEGLTFQVVSRDTLCDADKAAAATKDLADNQKVVAIIGESCSGATLGALPVANQKHVVLISPASSSPALTKAGDYFFRTYPSDNLQGSVVSKLMHDKGYKRLAIISSNEPYGQGLSAATKSDFEKLGGTVVANETFDRESVSMQTQLQRIKAASPDVLYIISNAKSSAAAVIIQAKQLGIVVPQYGSEALKDDELLNDVGAAANGLIVTAVSSGKQSFIDEYRTAYGEEPPSAGGAQTYDAFMALARVVKAGANTGDQIKAALPSVSFDGASGQVKFDNTGDLAGGNYNVYVVKDQKFSLVTQ